MATSRSRSRFPLRQVQRRKTSWQPGTGRDAPTTVSGTGKSILNLGIEFLQDGLTIVRTRGELLLYLESTVAGRDGFAGSFGIGVASAQAVAIGATALPGPSTDTDWDGWYYHTIMALRSIDLINSDAATAEDFGNVVTSALRLPVDSKAMRKVGINQVAFAMIEVTEVGTAVMQVNWNSRHLLKLP